MHYGWYENGEKQYDFNWKFGEPDGEFRHYHDNRQLSAKGQYNDGKLIAVKAWLRDGTPCSSTKISNGTGRWINRFDDGSIESSTEYRDGEPHGKHTSYYFGGQKYSEGVYQEGKHEGTWIYWHSNGQKNAEIKYVKGETVGEGKYWNEDGTTEATPNQRLAAAQEEAKSIRTSARGKISSERIKVTVAKQKILLRLNDRYGSLEELTLNGLEKELKAPPRQGGEDLYIWDNYGLSFLTQDGPALILQVQVQENHGHALHPWTGELFVQGKRYTGISRETSFLNDDWKLSDESDDEWRVYEKEYGYFLIGAWFQYDELLFYTIKEKN